MEAKFIYNVGDEVLYKGIKCIVEERKIAMNTNLNTCSRPYIGYYVRAEGDLLIPEDLCRGGKLLKAEYAYEDELMPYEEEIPKLLKQLYDVTAYYIREGVLIKEDASKGDVEVIEVFGTNYVQYLINAKDKDRINIESIKEKICKLGFSNAYRLQFL